ncbi:MAG: LLM class flavin-dependent oxidoreductase, partial [Candidatus Bathyarchaeia archaeon]
MAKFGVGILEKGSLRNFESQLRLVERVGYDQVWIPDERFYRDVFVSITVSALKTRRVKLGIAVTDP